ncbi:pyridoxamine 5'-phosphate oxidase family protein [Mycoplasma sp. P36-A1]|uniref:pyridoxamine 5'-phosphate oxidase family protein n=1 Tax=Mycoplasma sp. P36-A1 TaxID=3252900 RepID=UPI003C2BD885
MFREMRRFKQGLATMEIDAVLNRNSSGVLALNGDDGYPYTVPLNYVYHDGKIIFHGAKTGHKIDAINNSSKASFCVIDKDDVVAKEFTSKFRSVVAFGKVTLICDDVLKQKTIELLSLKYSSKYMKEAYKLIDDEWNFFQMFELEIEHITGKESTKLMMNK